MEHISDIVRRVIASLEKDAVIQTTGEPDGRPYLTEEDMYEAGFIPVVGHLDDFPVVTSKEEEEA